jgi:hypothetical protein
VIVGDLDVMGVASGPAKAHPPLVVDTDAVSALAVAGEFLQAVSRRYPQIVKRLGRVEERQFPQGGALQTAGELLTRSRRKCRSVFLSANPRIVAP